MPSRALQRAGIALKRRLCWTRQGRLPGQKCMTIFLEVGTGIEPVFTDLQSGA